MGRRLKAKTNLQVCLNGNPIDSVLSASIVTTNCFSADSFSLTFALDPSSGLSMDYWSETPAIYAEFCDEAQDEEAAVGLITGMVDSVTIDPIRRRVSIHGRDMSSLLIDNYRQQEFINQTAAEVVTAIAVSHNLGAAVTPTLGQIGRYVGDGFTRFSLGQYSRLCSDWDLVVDLARESGFDAFVRGRTLYFQPAEIDASSFSTLCFDEVMQLRIERSLNFGSSRSVRVQTWDSFKAMVYDSGSADADSAATRGDIASSGGQPFLFSIPNFTPSQAQNHAQRYSDEIKRLGTVLEFEMPWERKLFPRSRVVFDDEGILSGSHFVIESIERRYNSIFGSSQHVRSILVAP
jgi:hypothetical protein